MCFVVKNIMMEELVEELVGDWWGWFGGVGGLECGGEVVEGEDVGGNHGH